MRIIQVMLSKGWGGAERIYFDLVKSLAEQGVQVQAVMDERFPKKDQLEGVENVIPAYVRPFSHWDFFAAFKLYDTVHQFAPDVIHYHLCRAALMGGRCKEVVCALGGDNPQQHQTQVLPQYK